MYENRLGIDLLSCLIQGVRHYSLNVRGPTLSFKLIDAIKSTSVLNRRSSLVFFQNPNVSFCPHDIHISIPFYPLQKMSGSATKLSITVTLVIYDD